MIEIVDLLVRGAPFSQQYNTQRIPLNPGDMCLAESDIGLQLAEVLSTPRIAKKKYVGNRLPRVIRRASENDIEHLDEIIELEKEAETYCLSCIDQLKLGMKLARVIYSFDQSRVLFMFTAEKRVDFRGLVRELARTLKTRIEMRQIGIRDEARLVGGIGNCGCTLCCARFLREFHPVSIKMAKTQGLSLIPAKISGLCGRLMCCLQYEYEHYSEAIKQFPKVGKRVKTPDGEGRVRQVNVLTGKILVDMAESGEVVEYPGDVVERLFPSGNQKPQTSGTKRETPPQNREKPQPPRPVRDKQPVRGKRPPRSRRNKPSRQEMEPGKGGESTHQQNNNHGQRTDNE